MDVADAIHQALDLQDQQRYDEAIQILLAASERHEDEDLWNAIAGAYVERGMHRRDETALADFDEADKWADLPETKIGRAEVLHRRGEREQAEALLQEGLEAEFPQAFLVLAEVRLVQARIGDAKAAVARTLELAPKYAPAYVVLAEVMTAEGRADLAAKVLEEGYRKCGSHDRLLLALARSYRGQEDLGRARRALERAVELNGRNVDAWRDLAWVAAKDGDEETMRRALESAVEIDREGTLAWLAKEKSTLPELNAFGM